MMNENPEGARERSKLPLAVRSHSSEPIHYITLWLHRVHRTYTHIQYATLHDNCTSQKQSVLQNPNRRFQAPPSSQSESPFIARRSAQTKIRTCQSLLLSSPARLLMSVLRLGCFRPFPSRHPDQHWFGCHLQRVVLLNVSG